MGQPEWFISQEAAMEQSFSPPTHYVGIDVAAQTLAVVLTPSAAAPCPALTVPNTAAGWQTVQTTLTQPGATTAATVLVREATGAYW